MKTRRIWTQDAETNLEALPTGLVRQVEAEVETLFSDGLPSMASTVSGSTRFIELPCGVEVFFREIDGRVKIFAVSDPRV